MFRVVIDNLNYVVQKNSILASFLVVLDPRMQDFNQANNLLNVFNLLVSNKVIFNNLQFYNESYSRSSLLPNVSNFSCKIHFGFKFKCQMLVTDNFVF